MRFITSLILKRVAYSKRNTVYPTFFMLDPNIQINPRITLKNYPGPTGQTAAFSNMATKRPLIDEC